MKRVLLCLALATPVMLHAAEAKDEVTAAAKKLGEQANYTWKTTVAVPEGAQFQPGPTDGRTEKGGILHVKTTVPFGENATIEMFKKGDKAVINQEGEWQVLEPAGQPGGGGGGRGGGRGGFMGGQLRNVRVPAEQAAEIAASVKEFKKDGDAYVGEMTEEGAKGLVGFGRGGRGGGAGGGEGPTVTGAKGSAKFWIKDGVLTKFELKVSGKMDFNGNEIVLDRTTTTEISDIGKTKIEIPEGAKSKLS